MLWGVGGQSVSLYSTLWPIQTWLDQVRWFWLCYKVNWPLLGCSISGRIRSQEEVDSELASSPDWTVKATEMVHSGCPPTSWISRLLCLSCLLAKAPRLACRTGTVKKLPCIAQIQKVPFRNLWTRRARLDSLLIDAKGRVLNHRVGQWVPLTWLSGKIRPLCVVWLIQEASQTSLHFYLHCDAETLLIFSCRIRQTRLNIFTWFFIANTLNPPLAQNAQLIIRYGSKFHAFDVCGTFSACLCMAAILCMQDRGDWEESRRR